MIYQGDCLDWLGKVTDSSVDLVYIDPPFFTQRNFKDFVDRWDGIGSYVDYMRERVVVLHSKLKDTGSFMLHCDWHASHYLRVMLDEVFGYKNFVNEIIWSYNSGGLNKKKFARKHDNIFFYAKGKSYKFNKLEQRSYVKSIKHGTPWASKMNVKVDDKGNVYRDVCMRSVWELRSLFRSDKELVGYPTQKPEALLSRIIKCTTNEGDLVLDAFGGSGTTAAVAKKLKRKFITGDVNPKAVAIMRERLVKVD